MGLFKPKWQHKNPKKRITAIEMLEDQELLADIAKNDEDFMVRMAAYKKLGKEDSQEALADIAKNDEDNLYHIIECGSYACTERVRPLPGLVGWEKVPQPIFGGIEMVYFCPSHVKDGREKSKVTCKHCEKTVYLSDKPVGWDYVHTPAGTLWFCPEHIEENREYISAQWKNFKWPKGEDD